MHARVVRIEDDLEQLVADINSASWDKRNEMSIYDTSSLAAYLARQDTVFVACYDYSQATPVLLGIASSRIEMKPYEMATWLYVDELDVCADQRQKGVGTCIMQAILQIATEQGCEEVWLGTEHDNQPANALYRSLDPDDEAHVIGYTYETDE